MQGVQLDEHGFIHHGWGSIVMSYEPGFVWSAVG